MKKYKTEANRINDLTDQVGFLYGALEAVAIMGLLKDRVALVLKKVNEMERKSTGTPWPKP
jgi:hypothetical protein